MRIVIGAQLASAARTYRNAGVSRSIQALLAALDRYAPADDQYSAFVSAASPEIAGGTQTPERVRLVPTGWPTAHPLQRIAWERLALPGALRRLRADVYHGPVNVLPPRLPCASLVTVHDLAFLRFPQYYRPTRRLYQRRFTAASVRLATLIVAVSESTRRDLIALLGAAGERIRVIYPAIDADFQPVDDLAVLQAFRARHDLPDRYLLFLGTIEPRKNLLALVEAYARLRARADDCPPLVIAGARGWYDEALYARVRALGLERSVRFAGYVERAEQPLWYAAATAFVYPSRYEGFGLPVVEALACGTPTITTEVSSLPEAGGECALLVSPDDREGLAHTLLRVLSDITLRQRTRIEGPRWARRFSAARLAQAYAGCYHEAAAACETAEARSV